MWRQVVCPFERDRRILQYLVTSPIFTEDGKHTGTTGLWAHAMSVGRRWTMNACFSLGGEDEVFHSSDDERVTHAVLLVNGCLDVYHYTTVSSYDVCLNDTCCLCFSRASSGVLRV